MAEPHTTALAEDLLAALPRWELFDAGDAAERFRDFLARVRRLVEAVAQTDPTKPRISVHELRARRVSQQAAVNTVEILLSQLARAANFAEQHDAIKAALQTTYERGVIAGQTDIARLHGTIRDEQRRATNAEEDALAAAKLVSRAHWFYTKLRRGDVSLADLPAEFLSTLEKYGERNDLG